MRHERMPVVWISDDASRGRAGSAAADRPAVGNRLPEVLLIGQAAQPGPQPMLPMRLKLIDQFAVPVNVHRRIVASTTRRTARGTADGVIGKGTPSLSAA
jgi:hypothetical protein